MINDSNSQPVKRKHGKRPDWPPEPPRRPPGKPAAPPRSPQGGDETMPIIIPVRPVPFPGRPPWGPVPVRPPFTPGPVRPPWWGPDRERFPMN